jgi:HSP20 family protein
MAIVRWDPLGGIMRWPSVWEDDDWGATSSGSDNLDVYETENEVVIRASVAGVSEDKVDISFEKGVLTIRAEEIEEKKEGKKYYRKASRSYSYRVAVPGNVDVKKEPKAEIENGVVEIKFSKAEEAKPKKISVKKKNK